MVSTLSVKDDDLSGQKDTNSGIFPRFPPYNFVVLRKRLQHGRYIIDHSKSGSGDYVDSEKACKAGGSSSLAHPIGINWEVFRDDVNGMCNVAVERNKRFDSVDDSTLCNIANKIKALVEQIYEKTGKKQAQEMEVSNYAHRFTEVMNAAENAEAAMQGKKWRKEGKLWYILFTDTHNLHYAIEYIRDSLLFLIGTRSLFSY